MKFVVILESFDTVQPTDWCRPLSITSLETVNPYGGSPINNAKWVRVPEVWGDIWMGKPVSELNDGNVKYEFLRGEIPIENQLKLIQKRK